MKSLLAEDAFGNTSLAAFVPALPPFYRVLGDREDLLIGPLRAVSPALWAVGLAPT